MKRSSVSRHVRDREPLVGAGSALVRSPPAGRCRRSMWPDLARPRAEPLAAPPPRPRTARQLRRRHDPPRRGVRSRGRRDVRARPRLDRSPSALGLCDPALSERGLRVVAYDQRVTARATRPAGATTALERFGEDLEAVLTAAAPTDGARSSRAIRSGHVDRRLGREPRRAAAGCGGRAAEHGPRRPDHRAAAVPAPQSCKR